MSNITLNSPTATRNAATGERLGYVLAAVLAALGGYSGYQLLQNAAAPWMIWSLFGSIAALTLLFAVRIMHTRNAKYVCMAMGIPLLVFGGWLYTWKSEQIELYNQALVLLNKPNPSKEDVTQAFKLLEDSSKKYEEETKRGQLASLFLPPARRDIEARNHNHRGVIQVQNRKIKEAVVEFFTSLQYNAGNLFKGMQSEEAKRWESDAFKPKANLEKLYRMGQANGQAKGKGQGKGQPQQGPPDKEPGKDPANGTGKKPPGKL